MRVLRWFRVPLLLAAAGAVTFVLASGWVSPPRQAARPAVPSQAPAPVLRVVAQASEAAVPARSPEDRRGVYLTANAAGDLDWLNDVIDHSLAHGFNAIVIDVKDNSGTLGYASKLPLAEQIGAVVVRYDLGALVAHVHAKGLYFIARQVVFSDPKLAHHLGRPDEWVFPSDPAAVAYNLAVAEEVAAAGVDEIQFDYIRFPDDGALGRAYPERNAAVSSFFEKAHQRLAGKVHLSADVFGRTLWPWNEQGTDPIGQVLEQMAPYVDQISPMIYPSHYEVYFQARPREVVERGLAAGIERRLALRPYLQAFALRIPSGMTYTQYILEQLRGLQAVGVDGYLFWNPRSDYRELWDALNRR